MVHLVSQDISQAGSREGLAGERSGLFFEYVRVVKEMRERDRSSGRPDEFVRPRFLVFENVPGLFSSNKGEDFQRVLTEIVRIADPNAPDVPMPKKGKWPRAGLLYHDALGRKWSVAWRLHDAQFWGASLYDDEGTAIFRGTPQRRKRVALVADFNGLSAPEVLFEREGLLGYSEPSEEEEQTSAGDTEESLGTTGRNSPETVINTENIGGGISESRTIPETPESE